jgi:hypothetical protein
MAYVDDTAREGDVFGVVLSGASEDLSCEILELDGFSDTARFLEAIHIGVVRVRGGKIKREII